MTLHLPKGLFIPNVSIDTSVGSWKEYITIFTPSYSISINTSINKEAGRFYVELLSRADDIHASGWRADKVQMIYIIPHEILPKVSLVGCPHTSSTVRFQPPKYFQLNNRATALLKTKWVLDRSKCINVGVNADTQCEYSFKQTCTYLKTLLKSSKS